MLNAKIPQTLPQRTPKPTLVNDCHLLPLDYETPEATLCGVKMSYQRSKN
jgi:hypothetical protein